MTTVKITTHATARARERLRFSAESLERMAAKAFDIGARRKDFSGCMRNWLDEKLKASPQINNVRIYGEVVYVFSNHVLVTVFGLPNEFKRQVKRYNKSDVRVDRALKHS